MEENPSNKTIETYRQNFDKYIEKTHAEIGNEFQKWMDEFLSHIIPEGGVILEIGSAVGRDA